MNMYYGEAAVRLMFGRSAQFNSPNDGMSAKYLLKFVIYGHDLISRWFIVSGKVNTLEVCREMLRMLEIRLDSGKFCLNTRIKCTHTN